ncbi:MAG: hypothetical protein R3C41_21095 [Calditrichia bacterium]
MQPIGTKILELASAGNRRHCAARRTDDFGDSLRISTATICRESIRAAIVAARYRKPPPFLTKKVIIPRSLFIRDLSDRLKQVNENAIREADVRARAVFPERHRSDCQHCRIGNFAQHCRQRVVYPQHFKTGERNYRNCAPDQQRISPAKNIDITTDDEIARTDVSLIK